MKKIILLLLLFQFTLESCTKKTQNSIQEIINNNSFTSTMSDSDKILIRLKKPNQTESTTTDSCFESFAMYKAEKSNQIECFEKLFEDSNYTGYCCCPETVFSIDFYKNSKKIDTYFADTIEFKDKVRIFEQAYQYSFLIEKQKWKEYLKEIKTKE